MPSKNRGDYSSNAWRAKSYCSSYYSFWDILLTRLKVMKLFSCSTQLNTKFILLINVKMPTIVGILTFMSRINTTSERLKSRIGLYFSFYEQLKFHAQLSWAWKKFHNLLARLASWQWQKNSPTSGKQYSYSNFFKIEALNFEEVWVRILLSSCWSVLGGH